MTFRQQKRPGPQAHMSGMLHDDKPAYTADDLMVADLLVEQFGTSAAGYAAGRIAYHRDVERRDQWRRVFRRVSELMCRADA